jgi:hypothetical protein
MITRSMFCDRWRKWPLLVSTTEQKCNGVTRITKYVFADLPRGRREAKSFFRFSRCHSGN